MVVTKSEKLILLKEIRIIKNKNKRKFYDIVGPSNSKNFKNPKKKRKSVTIVARKGTTNLIVGFFKRGRQFCPKFHQGKCGETKK